jgi:hypothetical protein
VLVLEYVYTKECAEFRNPVYFFSQNNRFQSHYQLVTLTLTTLTPDRVPGSNHPASVVHVEPARPTSLNTRPQHSPRRPTAHVDTGKAAGRNQTVIHQQVGTGHSKDAPAATSVHPRPHDAEAGPHAGHLEARETGARNVAASKGGDRT